MAFVSAIGFILFILNISKQTMLCTFSGAGESSVRGVGDD